MDDLDLGATIKGFITGQKVFNRYTLVRILGRGGMGVVWLARDEELEREVALKFLPEVVAMDKEAIRDLKRETRRSLELTHPHIVRIYDFVQDAHTAAISMEYVAGETLAAKKVEQAGGHFEVAAIREWVRQWLEAMEYAHAQAKVAHRDIKPANLMIDGQGWLKVTDFGIAASMSDTASRVSNQFGSSGTPVYMSPQQMMGEKPAVTDDIYAIGATLYELLTGKPPFYSGNVLMQVQNKVPPSMAVRRSDLGVTGKPIPVEWEQTIAACLSKEASDRPQSAGEVGERLGLIAKGTKFAGIETEPASVAPIEPAATTAIVPSALPKAGILKSKTRLFAGLAAATALLGFAGWYLGLHAPEQRRLETERLRMEGQTRIERDRQQAEAARLARVRVGAEQDAAIRDNLVKLANAAGEYFQRQGGDEVSIATLILPGKGLGLSSVAGEDYWKIGRIHKGASIAVTTPTGVRYELNREMFTGWAQGERLSNPPISVSLTDRRDLPEGHDPSEADFSPVTGRAWRNSLGMIFVPVPGIAGWASIWKTRVQDYAVYVRETGADVRYYEDGRFLEETWDNPGFAQSPTHPVVVVKSPRDFADWLTRREREAGRLSPRQRYRLPTLENWSIMEGGDIYPWGDQWPPPTGAGNFADASVRESPFLASVYQFDDSFVTIKGYFDGHPHTSPVGSYASNHFGLYDIAGNARELLEGGWVVGSGFDWGRERQLEIASRRSRMAISRGLGDTQFNISFRLVLVEE